MKSMDRMNKKLVSIDVSDFLVEAVKTVAEDAEVREAGICERGSYADFAVPSPLSAHDLPAIERDLKRRVAGSGRADPAAVTVVSVSGVYPGGDETRPMGSRVLAVAFSTRDEFAEYLEDQERRNRLDHRSLGVSLGLFTVDETIGKGLPLLKPDGATLRRILERYIVDEEVSRGYEHVNTPIMGRRELYEISGHLDHYGENMFPPMKLDTGDMILRPMTCPHHFMLYKSELRSYRDLPIRYAEISPLFRNERSGSMYGLVRVLQFHLSDAHIFCTPAQIDEEFSRAVKLILFVMNELGLSSRVWYRLSLRDESNSKFIQDEEGWSFAETALRRILDDIGLQYEEAPGEAAFYGPKLDVQIENIHGKEETIFTNQLDIALQKRFDLQYVDADGKRKVPFVIHRSSLGCIERTMALLTEHYEGAFPLWLAPTQAVVLPVSPDAVEYAESVLLELSTRGIRATIDSREVKIGTRIHEAGKRLVPYILVVGGNERRDGSVTVKNRDTKKQSTYPLSTAVSKISQEAADRSLRLEV